MEEQRQSNLRIFDDTVQLTFMLQEILAKFQNHREGGEQSFLRNDDDMTFDD